MRGVLRLKRPSLPTARPAPLSRRCVARASLALVSLFLHPAAGGSFRPSQFVNRWFSTMADNKENPGLINPPDQTVAATIGDLQIQRYPGEEKVCRCVVSCCVTCNTGGFGVDTCSLIHVCVCQVRVRDLWRDQKVVVHLLRRFG